MMHSLRLAKFLLPGLIAALVASSAAAETLQQAWDIALSVGRPLKASRENTAAAANLLDASKSARLPSIGVEAGYTAFDVEPALKFGSAQVPMAQKDSTAYKAMAALPIYTGGRIERSIDAANASLEAARSGEIGDVQNLKLRVADSYVNVLRAQSALKVAESHVTSLESHASDVANLLAQGMVATSARLSAQVALLDARQKALQVANSLDLARATYNRLLGRSLDLEVWVEEFSADIQESVLAALTEKALAQRSELIAMASQIEALQHQAAAVRGENAPQVALTGGYAHQDNRYQVHEGQWVVGVGVKWNVFDGGGVRQRSQAVERQAAALSEQRGEVASVIGLQVRQAWLDVNETRKRTAVTASAIDQAEENLRVVRDRYANGLAPHTEVLDAETLRVNSETNHANSVFDAVMAGLRLKRATGDL
jgi:outer membrane protein